MPTLDGGPSVCKTAGYHNHTNVNPDPNIKVQDIFYNKQINE